MRRLLKLKAFFWTQSLQRDLESYIQYHRVQMTPLLSKPQEVMPITTSLDSRCSMGLRINLTMSSEVRSGMALESISQREVR